MKNLNSIKVNGLTALAIIIFVSAGPLMHAFSSLPRATLDEVRNYVSHLQYVPDDEELPYEALEMELDPKKPPYISNEKVAEDVERLFYLLSHGYAGYGYFINVGDFDEAKADILAELRYQPVWNQKELSSLIHKHLSFVRDCHLTIGEHRYSSHEDFWYDASIDLWEEDGGYRFTWDGTEYTVVSVNGVSPEGFLFPSLNANGDPVFRMGVLAYASPQPLELRAQSGQEIRQWKIKLSRSLPRYSERYEEKKVGGVPVVCIRSFGDHPREYIDQFIQTTSRYRGEPCLIVDIRGNGGGNEEWPKQWIIRFTGQRPYRSMIFTELISETTMMGRSNMHALALDKYPELEGQGYRAKVDEFRGYAKSIEEKNITPYWWPYEVPEPQEIPNNTTLIVLIDANVGSAAEGFISYLYQVENVVLVGENTWGALTYGQISNHRLPNSKLLVGLPISLNIFVDLEYREERGLTPDLWVPAEEALNYAVAAVRKGTITTSQALPEEILQEEFIPEKPSRRTLTTIEQNLVPVSVITGIIVTYMNRNKKLVFFIWGTYWILIGVYLGPIKPPIGYLFFILGLAYLAIGLYKWRKTKKALEINSQSRA